MPTKGEIKKFMIERRKAGKSNAEIAEGLNQLGALSPRGKKFTGQIVSYFMSTAPKRKRRKLLENAPRATKAPRVSSEWEELAGLVLASRISGKAKRDLIQALVK